MVLIPRFALLSLLLVGACSTTQSITVHEREPLAFAPWSDAPVVYRLGAGDRVKVDFLLTPELAQDAVVEPDGRIGLRVAGRVAVQNLTLEEAQAAVERAAAAHLRRPIVTLSLADPKAARIIVGGAVARPGAYPLPARGSTFEAVTLAGGLLPESRMDQVVVIRQRPGAAPMLRTVDLRRFVSTGAAGQSIALQPEDIVFVPKSRIAEINLWIEENIERTLPFSRSVSYTNATTVKP